MSQGSCPGIKPGPPPGLKNHPTPTNPNPSETPEKTRKPTCEPKDYVTATEVISLCVKKVMPVSVAVNSTTSTTISTCSGQTHSMKGCPPMPGMTTTEWQTLTETASCTESSTVYSTFSSCLVGTDSIGGTRTSSCMSTVSPIVGCDVTGGVTKTVSTTSKPGGCTLAPLLYNEYEGDNIGLEMKPNATGGSCPWSPLLIEDDEGDNVSNETITIPTLPMRNETNGGSCPWISIDIDDTEGDNYLNSNISIPLLPTKPSTKQPAAPSLPHPPMTKPPKVPTLSQTAHPTPSPSTSDSALPTATPKAKLIPAGGKWEIRIEHAPPQYHWTLYDASGNEAGGGDAGNPIQCYGRPLKDCFPFVINHKLNLKDVNSKVDFEVMLDLPSGRRLTFNNNHDSKDLPEDGYPDQNYGCRDDQRNQSTKGKSRTFWCYFVWHGQGGWDGLTDKVGW